MHSTLCARLMIFCAVNSLGSASASANQYADRGKIYKIIHTEANFDDSQAICEQDVGMLAKISQKTVTDNFYAPLSQFLRPHVGRSCAWIGAKDMYCNGWWEWTDGTDVVEVPWTITSAQEFFHKRYILYCGRLCLEDNKWIWQPADCATALKFVCEYVDPDAEHCVTACRTPVLPSFPEGFNSADPNRYVYEGKIFKIPDTRTNYANAVTYCERDGGRLAIIKQVPATKRLNTPMSRFLNSRLGENCAFIGASDLEEEGTWLWSHGTRIYSVRWTMNRNFAFFLRYVQDYARLCPGEKGWLWKQEFCHVSSEFVCEYDEPLLETTVKPTIKPEAKPVPKPKRKPVGKTGTKIVVTRLSDPKLIIGDPVLIKSAPIPTMCSRFCMQTENCELFNFNTATHECIGYRRTSSVKYRENAEWTVWVLRRI